jgi:hypothetical protein
MESLFLFHFVQRSDSVRKTSFVRNDEARDGRISGFNPSVE